MYIKSTIKSTVVDEKSTMDIIRFEIVEISGLNTSSIDFLYRQCINNNHHYGKLQQFI